MNPHRMFQNMMVAAGILFLGVLSAQAQDIPFDVSDSTARGVLIDIDALNTIAVVDGTTYDGSGADPATLLPNTQLPQYVPNFDRTPFIRGTWSVSGSTGTISFTTEAIEGFVAFKFAPAFITVVPNSFPPNKIVIDLITLEAEWNVQGRVNSFGTEVPLALSLKTTPGPWVFSDPIFTGTDFEGASVAGTTAGIEVVSPGIPHFCSETFHNGGTPSNGATACGDRGSAGVGYATPYPYLPSYGLIRMSGPTAIIGTIYNGYTQNDLGDQKWVETCGDGTPDANEECDDGNNDDGDCCSSTCTTEAPGSNCAASGDECVYGQCNVSGECEDIPVTDGTVCSDEDACTIGDQCASGECVSGATTPPDCGGDRFCYKVKLSKNGSRFLPETQSLEVDENLIDPSSTAYAYDLKKPLEMCAPAGADGAAAIDTVSYSIAYKLKRGRGQDKYERQIFSVTDRFGSLTLESIKEDQVLEPASVGIGTLPPVLDWALYDHFLCYKVKTPRGAAKLAKGIQVTVADPLEDRLYDIKKPTRVCVVADADGSGLQNSSQAMTCYMAKRAKGQAKHVKQRDLQSSDEFGDLILESIVEAEFCTPASMAN